MEHHRDRLAAAPGVCLLLAACSHAARPGPALVTLAFCGSGPQVRPEVVEIC
jgi:hypothetical protein